MVASALDVDFVGLRRLTVVTWSLKFLRELHLMGEGAVERHDRESVQTCMPV